MKIQLKHLDQQTIVLTGATSGIGLATARRAAKAGVRLMLIARDETALAVLADELTRDGAPAVAYTPADVADESQLQAAADGAIDRFGSFDTWINNAGVSVYGRIADVSLEDQRKLFETNFWGVVNGSRVALKHLRERGGALINLGSELSDVAVPLQGPYVASKHAVKGFTNSLRLELKNEKVPVSVTLIKPAGIDTLFVEHAKNYLDEEPKLPPPVYAPDIVAKAILHAAVHPERDIYVGGASRAMAGFGQRAPRLYDAITSLLGVKAQSKGEPKQSGDALYERGGDLRERSGKNGRVREFSLYTDARLQPAGARAAFAGAAAVLLVMMARRYVRQTRDAY
ncbi:SDR family oxidoreductase [Caballeronia sp. LZ001]|uniref:SDR family oxidoreductase n=2 Tax=Caballeronia TaxID=1827195 RepID=UPI002854A318|nr:SDR family oxidoreductase [Caballeronia sp. LZ001]MDR5806342.1 SDR family oxidoreductase [Caballeronia sp. LZ001]